MSVLDGIVAGVLEDLSVRQSEVSLDELKARAADIPPTVDPMPGFRTSEVSIIAEVKRKSPSKGALAEITDPAALAGEYALGGAAAISVLTEQRRFGGSLADLAAVRKAVDVPLLRKDFIVTPYQLWEARAWGADLALLMVVSLPGGQLEDLLGLATEIGLTALVEAHTEDELTRAVDVGAQVIGINARDLTTLNVDRTVLQRLVPQIPDDRVRVAESGVSGPADVADYYQWGADVVLVGEALVKSGDPRSSVGEFIRKAGSR
ncbi:indole-3-glycerol phosphate synthase TrpC [Kibdelosporangium philippinense]|uniref:Indole-3-glycerol phosphate synthase n=1 Tax=Kibdelosporangium philippinense TaxID=211113 RepID=A0ABS8ZWR8_9PSEU|nr:indole-3-glycerol phosphate synthase TrpC [Kibdelosporangium philippinense]MCE7010302.1 indole-3-glycerol phosphate synthase TrpC [Kibdelosporangium philippinense]